MPETSPAITSAVLRLRPAREQDRDHLAQLWHGGWHDAHRGHVPEALLAHRQLEHFRGLLPERIAVTTVAVSESGIVGFVTVIADEIELLFVAPAARGGGTAAVLLAHGATLIGHAGHAVAWLAVVEGNARARRFYEREGWRDAAAIDYRAEIPGGTLAVPSRRYEKQLRS